MKAAIVLLSDNRVQNYARQIVFYLNRQYQVPLFASLLPSHVSLKQPFAFESMERLEQYFDELAARTAPFEIELNGFYHETWSGYGILGLNVVETPALRQLHNQLNQDLTQVVADPTAAFDGSEYRFHLTIEMGKVEDRSPFQEVFNRIAHLPTPERFLAREMALFYYPDEGSFITYRVQPLGGLNRS